MSADSKLVELSSRAKADYASILRYTSRRWGERQRDIYSGILERALETIGSNPEIGRPRDEIRSGLHAFEVEQHVIFYRIKPSVIRVERILHVKMDAASRFK